MFIAFTHEIFTGPVKFATANFILRLRHIGAAEGPFSQEIFSALHRWRQLCAPPERLSKFLIHYGVLERPSKPHRGYLTAMVARPSKILTAPPWRGGKRRRPHSWRLRIEAEKFFLLKR